MNDSGKDIFTAHSSINTIVGGKRLTIKGEGSKQYLEEVAKFANEKIEEVENAVKESGVDIGKEKVLLLAAINIADELFKNKYFENSGNIKNYPQIQKETEKIEAIIKKMIDSIDGTL